MSFSDYLKSLINQAGYSYAEVAERAGISRGYVYALIMNGNSPTLDVLIKLATCFGLTLTEFIAPLDTGEIPNTRKVEVVGYTPGEALIIVLREEGDDR